MAKQQRGDGSGEDPAHHHGERCKGPLGYPLLGGGGGADGVGTGPHGEPLRFRIGHFEQFEQRVADQGTDNPHHHHHGGRDGGNAADGLADAHGERGGDGFGRQ